MEMILLPLILLNGNVEIDFVFIEIKLNFLRTFDIRLQVITR